MRIKGSINSNNRDLSSRFSSHRRNKPTSNISARFWEQFEKLRAVFALFEINVAIPARIRSLRPLEHLQINFDGKAITERTVVMSELSLRPAGDRHFDHSEIQMDCVIDADADQSKNSW